MKQLKVNNLTPLVEFLINNRSTGVIKINDTIEFVDLGVSVLWAKCNIGAEKETDPGNYYQWGGLKPMDNEKCNWENAPFNDGKTTFNKKYYNNVIETVAPDDILDKKYDVATHIYGNGVHMPSRDNFIELIEKTYNEWVEINGIGGYKFISKSYDNNIFIPVSGYKTGNIIKDNKYDVYVWSSDTCGRDSCYAYHFYVVKTAYSVFASSKRCFGMPIRPVKNK